MKRIFLLGFALLAFLAACTDTNEPPMGAGGGNEYDWQAGRRVYTFNPWQDSVRIEIDKNVNPDVGEMLKRFTYNLIQGSDSNIMEFFIHDTVAQRPFLVKIPVEVEDIRSDKRSDTLYIVCKNQSTKELESVDIPLYQRNIGKCINASGSAFAIPENQVIDINSIVKYNLLELDGMVGSFGRGKTDMNYEEMTESMWEDLGISGKLGTQRIGVFSGSFDQYYEKNEHRQNKYQYHYDIHVKTIVRAHLPNSMSILPETMLPHLTDDANAALNDPTSPLYKLYPNTYAGIEKLYNDWGTHVMTGGIFGGRYIYFYSRKENYYCESVANSATVELGYLFADQASSGTENLLQTYYRSMGKHKGTLTAAGGNTKSEASAHMEEFSTFIIVGGNASYDMDSWDQSIVSIDDDNLALVSFCDRDNLGGINVQSEAQDYMFPLYKLAYDPERRVAMKKYLEEYLQKHYKGIEERPRMIVTDFFMQRSDNGHGEEAKTRVFKDAEGKERVYVPLVANSNCPEEGIVGAMLDTSSDDFIVTVDEVDQIWWVALGFEDECRAIKNICFIDEDDNKDLGNKYVLRGDRADWDMNWPAIDNHYVGIEFYPVGTTPDKPITGIGLARKKDSKYKVIASSPGTDMLKPYNDSSRQAQFRRFWGDNNEYGPNDKKPYSFGLMKDKDISQGDAWFGSCNADNAGHYILPVFSTDTLSTKITFQKPRQYDKSEEDPEDDYINN